MQIGLLDNHRGWVESTKLSSIEPGLIKIDYSYMGKSQKEFALRLTSSLADCVLLPNDALDYRDFLRDGMKSAVSGGIKVIGPFSGRVICDEYIECIDGRVVQLNSLFCNLNKNFNPLLIACNNSFFKDAISEMKETLLYEGFNVDNSRWDDYKNWEAEKLETF